LKQDLSHRTARTPSHILKWRVKQDWTSHRKNPIPTHPNPHSPILFPLSPQDPYNVNLQGLLSAAEYEKSIEMVNEHMKPSRAKAFDQAMFYGIGSIVFSAPCAYMHMKRKKRRKKLLLEAIDRFNAAYPHLMMRWNRRPESKLTIEARVASSTGIPPPPQYAVPVPAPQNQQQLSLAPPSPPSPQNKQGDLLTFDMAPIDVNKKVL
jgi:hypothetical protein